MASSQDQRTLCRRWNMLKRHSAPESSPRSSHLAHVDFTVLITLCLLDNFEERLGNTCSMTNVARRKWFVGNRSILAGIVWRSYSGLPGHERLVVLPSLVGRAARPAPGLEAGKRRAMTVVERGICRDRIGTYSRCSLAYRSRDQNRELLRRREEDVSKITLVKATACDNSRVKHDWVFEWIFKSEWQSRQDNSSTHTLFVLSSLWQVKRLRQSIHNQVSEIKPVSEVAICRSLDGRCLVFGARCSLLQCACCKISLTSWVFEFGKDQSELGSEVEARKNYCMVRVVKRDGDGGVDEEGDGCWGKRGWVSYVPEATILTGPSIFSCRRCSDETAVVIGYMPRHISCACFRSNRLNAWLCRSHQASAQIDAMTEASPHDVHFDMHQADEVVSFICLEAPRVPESIRLLDGITECICICGPMSEVPFYRSRHCQAGV
ncbi:hypothetical protein KC345_g132 [Hortaea werneckii]|nr:hypothetical protein KC345_g132 [Hortaea werneckii]